IRTDAASLRRPRNFEGAHFGAGFGKVKSQRYGAADSGSFQKTTARKFQEAPPDRSAAGTMLLDGWKSQADSRTRMGKACSTIPPCLRCASTTIFQATSSAGGDFGKRTWVVSGSAGRLARTISSS